MARSDRLSPYRTTWVRTAFGGSVNYVSTQIVQWDETSDAATVTLRSGGWETVTTKRKMNQAARQFNLGYCVYQQKHKWYVAVFANGRDWSAGAEVFDFYDGITVRVGCGFPLMEAA